MNYVFVALIEVKPLEGCELDLREFEGAAVRCYVPASDESRARALLSNTLERNRFELVKEEFFVREDLVGWENLDSEEAEKAIAEAGVNVRVVFSKFHAWGYDAPDSYMNTLGEQARGGNV